MSCVPSGRYPWKMMPPVSNVSKPSSKKMRMIGAMSSKSNRYGFSALRSERSSCIHSRKTFWCTLRMERAYARTTSSNSFVPSVTPCICSIARTLNQLVVSNRSSSNETG